VLDHHGHDDRSQTREAVINVCPSITFNWLTLGQSSPPVPREHQF
jgi:hypothetical protein